MSYSLTLKFYCFAAHKRILILFYTYLIAPIFKYLNTSPCYSLTKSFLLGSNLYNFSSNYNIIFLLSLISISFILPYIIHITNQGWTQELGGGDREKKKKISNTHPYSIKKLSTKTNTQKSLILNIIWYNHLPTKTKDTKHYCFLIQSSMKMEFDALLNLQNHLWLNPN